MRAIDAELDAQTPVVRSIVQPWMGWAAAAAVLICLVGAWWFTQGKTPQQLAEEFEITEPGLPVLMGTSPRTMDAIMNAYKQEDFAVAAGRHGAERIVPPPCEPNARQQPRNRGSSETDARPSLAGTLRGPSADDFWDATKPRP